MKFHRICLAMLFGISLILSACGGSDDSSSPAASAKFAPREKAVATDYNNAVQELYIGYFGRPADPAGLANFEAALLAAGAPTDVADLTEAYSTNGTIQALINSFGTSNESVTLYGSGNTDAFVTAIFQNIFNRAPASSGLSFWQNAIDNGGLSRGNAALSIMNGALTNTTAQGLLDAQLVANKVVIASAFTTAAASESTVYSGQVAAASARTMLGTVTSTTVASSFQATITSTLATMAAQAAANTPITFATLQACPNVTSISSSPDFYQCMIGSATGTTTFGNNPCTLTIASGGTITLASGSTVATYTYPYGNFSEYTKTSEISASDYFMDITVALENSLGLHITSPGWSSLSNGLDPAGIAATAGTLSCQFNL